MKEVVEVVEVVGEVVDPGVWEVALLLWLWL